MKFRLSIGMLMLMVLSAALALAAARSPALRPYALAFWLLAVPLVTLAHLAWFVAVPRFLLGRLAPADPARQLRLLELVVATPSLIGGSVKTLARYQLLIYHQACHRDGEAAAVARDLLRIKLPPGLQSDVRRRLADGLERLGEPDEAARERLRAAECLRGGPGGHLEQLSRGRLLAEQGRHAEAYEAFERGLEQVPASASRESRAEFLGELMRAALNAGRYPDAARWAEAVIASGIEGDARFQAHRVAGAALGDLGRFDQAEAHRRRALEMAEASGRAPAIAISLGLLADIERKRGRLAEAEATCRRADELAPGRFELGMTWADVLRAQGRYDEALDRLRRSAPDRPLDTPAADRRVRALIALGMSWIEADARRWGEAEAHLGEAAEGFRGDAKLSLFCEATGAQVAAGLGRGDQARAAAIRAEARIADFPEARSIRLGTLSSLGKAALILGDFERAEGLWARYLEDGPDPVHRPLGLYFLGESRLGLGRVDAAHDAFRQAVESGVDGHHARLARDRLGAGAVGAAGRPDRESPTP